MGNTPHHGYKYPENTDPFDLQKDYQALADSVTTTTPRITYGTGDPPTSGMVPGDIHVKYV